MIYGTLCVTSESNKYRKNGILLLIDTHNHTYLMLYDARGRKLQERLFMDVLSAQIYAQDCFAAPLEEWFNIPDAPPIPVTYKQLEELAEMLKELIHCYAVQPHIRRGMLHNIYVRYDKKQTKTQNQINHFVLSLVKNAQETLSLEYLVYLFRKRIMEHVKRDEWDKAIKELKKFTGDYSTHEEIRAYLEQFYEQEIAQKEQIK